MTTRKTKGAALSEQSFKKLAAIHSNPDTAVARATRSAKAEQKRDQRLAIVLLENIWWKFGDNPGFASSEPFFQGLSRYDDNAVCYRLPFYEEASFKKAVEFAKTVPHPRAILHIGAHAEEGRIGGVPAGRLFKSLNDLRPHSGKRIEGVILSSCSAGKDTGVVEAAFQCGASWVFAYKVDVDWMGSALIDVSVAEEISLESDDSYTASVEEIAKSIADGLKKFNPHWHIDSDRQDDDDARLANAITLWAKPRGARKPQDITPLLRKASWGLTA